MQAGVGARCKAPIGRGRCPSSLSARSLEFDWLLRALRRAGWSGAVSFTCAGSGSRDAGLDVLMKTSFCDVDTMYSFCNYIENTQNCEKIHVIIHSYSGYKIIG